MKRMDRPDTGKYLLVNFIGREDEVSLLYGCWREVGGGEGQVLLLSGEAGIGKSRIIQILCDRIADEHHNIIRYQRSPYHTNFMLFTRTLTGAQRHDDRPHLETIR
jgi:AAA ATPase domain